jgi:beta-N-acetylhexosaminidase
MSMRRRLRSWRGYHAPALSPADAAAAKGLSRRARAQVLAGVGMRAAKMTLTPAATRRVRAARSRPVAPVDARSTNSLAGSRRQLPRWLLRLAVAAGLALLGVRAGLASATFMAPGGAIIGWSRLPSTRCAFCGVAHVAAELKHPLTAPEYAAILTQHMSLDDELGQMMMVQFVGLSATPDVIQMINAQSAGGVIFFNDNIQSAQQVKMLTAQLQQVASVPLLLAVDQEGGLVNRFQGIVGPLPGAASLPDPTAAYVRGVQDATLLHQLGFNLNLAPVVDVGTSNPQLYGRTFGDSPQRVATMAAAYLEGLQASGQVTACLKHFPGLGATSTDPHIGLPVLSRSRADWERIDLEPYRLLLKTEDVRAIMVSHEMIPAVDPRLPTSLSPAIIDGTLRGALGYNGVVITDSLYMGAINVHWSVAAASVLAIRAGADMVIGPYTPELVQETRDALQQAIASGVLTKQRIDASAQRLLALKIRMGLIPLPRSTSGQPSGSGPRGRLPDALPMVPPRPTDMRPPV